MQTTISKNHGGLVIQQRIHSFRSVYERWLGQELRWLFCLLTILLFLLLFRYWQFSHISDWNLSLKNTNSQKEVSISELIQFPTKIPCFVYTSSWAFNYNGILKLLFKLLLLRRSFKTSSSKRKHFKILFLKNYYSPF